MSFIIGSKYTFFFRNIGSKFDFFFSMEKGHEGKYVDLDVGGTHFKTSLSTLLKGDTMLSALFSGRIPIEKDLKGRVFLDRDGKHFNLILNFLRDGVISLPENKQHLEELKREAQYYCIHDLVELCDSDNSPCKMREKMESEHMQWMIEKVERINTQLSELNYKNGGYLSLRTDEQNQRFMNATENVPRHYDSLDGVRLPILPASITLDLVNDAFHHDG